MVKLAYQGKLDNEEGQANKKAVQTIFVDVPSKGREKKIISVVIRNQKKVKTKQADLKIIGIRPHGQAGLEIILKEED